MTNPEEDGPPLTEFIMPWLYVCAVIALPLGLVWIFKLIGG